MKLDDILEWMSRAAAKAKALRADVADLRTDVATLKRQPGPPGKSAFELAAAAGFRGTEAEWRKSLQGKDGIDAKEVDLGEVVRQVIARVPEPKIPAVEEIAALVVVPPAQVPSAAEIAALVPRAEPTPPAAGKPGPMGPMPDHQWDGTKLRFQKPSGWGSFVDLQGPKGDDGKTPRGYQGGPIFVEGAGGAIDDGAISADSTWSSQKVAAEIAAATAEVGSSVIDRRKLAPFHEALAAGPVKITVFGNSTKEQWSSLDLIPYEGVSTLLATDYPVLSRVTWENRGKNEGE